MDLGLRGRTAIITGGANGIGRGISLTFAHEGANVVVCDINAAAAQQAAAEARALGVRAIAAVTDVTDIAQVDRMVADAIAEFGTVEILVNNTGVRYKNGMPVAFHPFVETSIDDWHAEMELVLYGTVHTCKAISSHMIANGGGRIVNIGSPGGQIGMSGIAPYGVGKAGVIQLTRLLATELAPHRIRVNCVTPGFVASHSVALIESKMKQADPETYAFFKKTEQQWVNAIPLGGPGTPEDLANMVTFLASDATRWVTGQVINVDGGQVMK